MCVSKRHINLPLFVAHPDYLLQIIAVVSLIGGARRVGWEGWVEWEWEWRRVGWWLQDLSEQACALYNVVVYFLSWPD